MDIQFPKYTPVKHKFENYTGWIHNITKMETLFTGNKDTKWQYTISVIGEERKKVAPHEDVEFVPKSRQFPPFITVDESKHNTAFKSQTKLHALGYQLSDMTRNEREEVLIYVAIPILGPREVIHIICGHMHSKLKAGYDRAQKFREALMEWKYDLHVLSEKYKEDEEMKDPAVLNYIQKVVEEMDINGIKGE